jgi:hypothetical protein
MATEQERLRAERNRMDAEYNLQLVCEGLDSCVQMREKQEREVKTKLTEQEIAQREIFQQLTGDFLNETTDPYRIGGNHK